MIKGAGYGHGIGMSQYGAYGYAKHGFDYRQILAHYYSDTTLASVSPRPEVRVLLQSGRSSASVTGAVSASGRKLSPNRTYSATRAANGQVALRSATGRVLATFAAPLRFRAAKGSAIVLRGRAGNGISSGKYRRAIEVRPAPLGGVNAINALGLEDYVRGVISRESPPSWPAEALKAQAVAARTYAITTNAGTANDGFDQYPDVRSQVYGGVAAERPSTDAAVKATAGQVVTYGGRPVATYFFSTSGGHTENVEFSFIGALPRPWLRGVKDPFDGDSPKHRWGPIRLTLAQADAKLGSLVKGAFRGIDVIKRGVSPRVVRAEIIGTGGRTVVTGPELRKRLGLFDTWAYFTTTTSDAKDEAPPEETSDPSVTGDPSSGGTSPPP